MTTTTNTPQRFTITNGQYFLNGQQAPISLGAIAVETETGNIFEIRGNGNWLKPWLVGNVADSAQDVSDDNDDHFKVGDKLNGRQVDGVGIITHGAHFPDTDIVQCLSVSNKHSKSVVYLDKAGRLAFPSVDAPFDWFKGTMTIDGTKPLVF